MTPLKTINTIPVDVNDVKKSLNGVDFMQIDNKLKKNKQPVRNISPMDDYTTNSFVNSKYLLKFK